MQRRLFLSGPAAMAATASAICTSAQAQVPSTFPPVNLVYTEDNTGIWESKKTTHLPVVEVSGAKVTVTTPHGLSPTHFIVRHTLLLANGTVVGGVTFTAADVPRSEYRIPDGYKGRIYATSFCNQHDLWVTEATV